MQNIPGVECRLNPVTQRDVKTDKSVSRAFVPDRPFSFLEQLSENSERNISKHICIYKVSAHEKEHVLRNKTYLERELTVRRTIVATSGSSGFEGCLGSIKI